MVNEKLKENLLGGDFKACKKICRICENYTYEKLESDVMSIAFETDNIVTYLFILDLLFEKESSELHCIASSLLSSVFMYIPGAYYNAYNHMLKAVKFNPDNYEYMEGLLLFYHIPEKIIDENMALEIAKKILRINPESKSAQSILKMHL